MADINYYQRLTEVYTLDNKPLLIASAVSYVVGYLQYMYVIRLTLREGKGPMPFWMHSFYLAHDSTWSYILGKAAIQYNEHWFLRGTSTALFVWTTLEMWTIHRAVTKEREANFASVLGSNPSVFSAAVYALALQLGMYTVVLLGIAFMGEGCVMQWFCFTNVLIVLGPTHQYLRNGSRHGLSLGFCLVNIVGTIWTFAPFSFFVLTIPEVFDNTLYYVVGCILTVYSIGCYFVVSQYPAKTADMSKPGKGAPICAQPPLQHNPIDLFGRPRPIYLRGRVPTLDPSPAHRASRGRRVPPSQCRPYREPRPSPRVITYYQTHHTPDGKPISILPLITQPDISVTHVILAAIHINDDPHALTLNDHRPDDPRFLTLWAELRVLQASGVKVLGMLGGAARGSYERLDGDDEAKFEKYYIPLRDMVRKHALDGIDLDVEEEMSLGGVIRLIDRIRQDFGKDFIITMAPVAMALLDPFKNLSGFDYEALEVMRGKEIAWYNAQFYCGWGDCSNPVMYEMLLAKGWAPEKIVIGLVTNPENGGGWVPWEMLGSVLLLLRGRYERFGGVMGWEYFNSLPGGREKPWEWAQWMTTMLRSEKASSWPAHGVLPVETSEIAKVVKKELVDEVDPDGPNSKDAPLPASFDYYSDTNLDDD